MTISKKLNRWTYDGDGAQAVFQYKNKIFASSDLQVYVGAVLQTEVTHYTVSDVGAEAGGNVTFVTAPVAGTANVLIVRAVPETQGTDLPIAGVFPAESVESMADKNTVLIQQVSDKVARALVLSDSDPDSFGAMPLLSTFFGKYIGIDGAGVPTPGVSLTDQSVTYEAKTFSGDNSKENFTLSAAPASAEATDVFISGVRQVPGTDYSILGTTLTFTSAPPTGTNNIFVVFSQSFAGVPSDGSVTAAKIATGAVLAAAIGAGAVVEAGIGADAVAWPTKIKAAAAGDLPVFDNSGDPALLAKGTALQYLRMNAGATALEYFTPIFSGKYTSPEQTITADGTLTLTHGLTVTNAYEVSARAVLICKTAEYGYAIGDVVPVNASGNDVGSAAGTGVSIIVTPTQLKIHFSVAAGVFRIISASVGGGDVLITPANWKIRFIAYV